MKRRELITVLGGTMATWPLAPPNSFAQSAKVYRLGTLTPGPAMAVASGPGEILINTLGKHGYALGKNLVFEARGAGGATRQLPTLMQELKTAKVDVVVTVSYPAVVAAKASGVPTVIASGSGDPVATGLVESLPHPGGNVTGIADDAASLSTKRLALLKAVLPNLRRVAMLWNKDDLGMSLRYEASAKAAEGMGVDVQALGVREPDDFNEAFATMTRALPDAILMVSDALTILNRKRVIDFAAANRLPAIYEFDGLVRDGGLMSYGADPRESFARAAELVESIFKGAKPADLPVEQPTRYLFVINLKTAKAIGLSIPAHVAALADDVVE